MPLRLAKANRASASTTARRIRGPNSPRHSPACAGSAASTTGIGAAPATRRQAAAASSVRPCCHSQRGLSGTSSTPSSISPAGTAAARNIACQFAEGAQAVPAR